MSPEGLAYMRAIDAVDASDVSSLPAAQARLAAARQAYKATAEGEAFFAGRLPVASLLSGIQPVPPADGPSEDAWAAFEASMGFGPSRPSTTAQRADLGGVDANGVPEAAWEEFERSLGLRK